MCPCVKLPGVRSALGVFDGGGGPVVATIGLGVPFAFGVFKLDGGGGAGNLLLGRGALNAAKLAAAEQKVPGATATIEFEDAKGQWHTETDRGDDRPSTSVKDTKR